MTLVYEPSSVAMNMNCTLKPHHSLLILNPKVFATVPWKTENVLLKKICIIYPRKSLLATNKNLHPTEIPPLQKYQFTLVAAVVEAAAVAEQQYCSRSSSINYATTQYT